jgi:glycosyltransferase involved in cell wall biosynthesis
VLLLHRRGHPTPPYAAYLAAEKIEFQIIPDEGPLDVRLPGRARAVLRDWAPDVLQSHGYKATAVAWALRRMGGTTPWIGFFHGSTTESKRAHVYHWLDRRMLGAADRVIGMSDRHLREFARYGERARVIHNAVIRLPARPSPDDDALLARVTSEASGPILGVVGRLSPEKGVDIFLEACAIVARSGVAFTALIAGDGPEEQALRQQARVLDLDDRVRFLGHISAVDRLYPHLDILVIPSRSEGLPNVLLEALAADVRVVSTSVGAVPEVLTDPDAGTLVPPTDVEALAAALSRAITDPTTPREVAARAETAERFSLRRRADAHAALYAELRGHPAGGALPATAASARAS